MNGWGHAPLVTPEFPSLKYRELRRLVLADGWRKVRQRGSHELYEHPRKHGHVTIAGHDGEDVPLGTLRSVFKQAGAMKYSVVFENADDGGVGAYIPDIPGIGVVGRDFAEARSFIDIALEMHVEAMIEDGDPLPTPSPIEDPDGPFVVVPPSLLEQAEKAARQKSTP